MNEELQQVEATIADAQEYLEFANNEETLSKNDSFKTLVIDGYFRDEAARLAGLLAEPSMVDKVNQRELQSALKGISHFRQYLINIRRTRNSIETSLQDHKDLADEIRAEES